MNEFVLDENPINVDAIKANILEIEKEDFLKLFSLPISDLFLNKL